MPSPGFQALILCGPGVSLNTFTSSPEQFPKALVSIANRAMIWYPLEWCYRMGITSESDMYRSPYISFTRTFIEDARDFFLLYEYLYSQEPVFSVLLCANTTVSDLLRTMFKEGFFLFAGTA